MMVEVLCKFYGCEAGKKIEKVILIFQLAEQICRDCEKEHISFMILNL